MTSPEGMLVLQVPMFSPTEEEIRAIESVEGVEPFLQHLRNDNYLTNEELAAYLKFVNIFSMYAPFILDSFLEGYRNSKKPRETDKLIRV